MTNELNRAAWAEVSLGAIRSNFLKIRALAPDSEALACVKADAYGHGIVQTAQELADAGADYLAVATLDEAAALRSAGIHTPIVVLSATPRNGVNDILDLGLVPVVTTYADARLLSDAALRAGGRKEVPFFIALETGMGRLGFMPTKEGLADIAAISALPGIRMAGLFSHFSTSDEPALPFARAQLEAFREACVRLREAGVKIGKRTMANSAAILTLPESHFEIIRPGIALYGIYPSAEIDQNLLPLTPAMSVKASIVYLKKVPPGFAVSYGRRFVTQRESLIATLPLGYGDGLPRNQAGKARVLIRGQYAPIIGTICMDQCMVDVTDIPGVSEYDEVVILGTQGKNSIPAEEIAANADTIPYEILCRFGQQRLPRIYIE